MAFQRSYYRSRLGRSRTILVSLVLVAVSCTLSSCGGSTSIQKVGEHDVVIIETSLLGGGASTSTLRGAEGVYEYYTYESGRLKIRLENEVLTVNGKRYLIPNKNDSIEIRNNRVEINGRPAKPSGG